MFALRANDVTDLFLCAHHTSFATPDDPGVEGTLNQRRAIKLLEQHGWVRQRGGKHQIKMVKPGRRPITLPRHRGRDYSPGLSAAILRQAGLR
jgi:predicted RNA binding protein YcfA (HicA-like mRNA interferase family)